MQYEPSEREGKSRGGRNGYTYLSRERPNAGSDHRAREPRNSVTAWLGTGLTKLARASVTQSEWLTYRSHDSGGGFVGGARRTEARTADPWARGVGARSRVSARGIGLGRAEEFTRCAELKGRLAQFGFHSFLLSSFFPFYDLFSFHLNL